jgi:hypothetical protein
LARIKREHAPQPKIGRRSERVEDNEEEVLNEIVSDEADIEESADDVEIVTNDSEESIAKESPWKFNSKQVLTAFIAILAIIIAIVGAKLIRQEQEQTELRKASIYLDQSRKAEKSKEESKKQSIADSRSIEKSKSIEASVAKSQRESVSASESRSVAESISVSESQSISASKSVEEEKAKADFNISEILVGDFSSAAGTWKNGSGDTLVIDTAGNIAMGTSESGAYINPVDMTVDHPDWLPYGLIRNRNSMVGGDLTLVFLSIGKNYSSSDPSDSSRPRLLFANPNITNPYANNGYSPVASDYYYKQ